MVGFVFVSGYFGINFAWRKAFKLVGVCFWGALLSVLLKCIVTGSSVDGYKVFVDVMYSVINGYWFVWAYIALMLISPILNAAAEGEGGFVNRRIIPFLVLVYGWSYVAQLPHVKNYIPMYSGSGQLSVLTLAAIYVCARIVRMRNYDECISKKMAIVLAVVTIPVCCLGFSHYHSPFSFVLVLCFFGLFKKISIPMLLQRCLLFVTPSLLSVYILHQCLRGFNFVTWGMNVADKVASRIEVCTLVAAIVVFVSCIVIDLLARRSLLYVGRSVVNGVGGFWKVLIWGRGNG